MPEPGLHAQHTVLDLPKRNIILEALVYELGNLVINLWERGGVAVEVIHNVWVPGKQIIKQKGQARRQAALVGSTCPLFSSLVSARTAMTSC